MVAPQIMHAAAGTQQPRREKARGRTSRQRLAVLARSSREEVCGYRAPRKRGRGELPRRGDHAAARALARPSAGGVGGLAAWRQRQRQLGIARILPSPSAMCARVARMHWVGEGVFTRVHE